MKNAVALRPLGNTGHNVSEIGLGCWQLGGDWGPLEAGQAEAILRRADESGITLWDTADVYGGGESERLIGAWQTAHPKADRVIITKVGRTSELYADGYTAAKLKAAIDASRDRLQMDTLDMVQLHCIPMAELQRGRVFEWLETFQQQGLIGHYGASVETVEQANYCLQNTQVASLQL
ncbi:MAG: aldo/keto reductase, partial [Natronospirillum sp.]